MTVSMRATAQPAIFRPISRTFDFTILGFRKEEYDNAAMGAVRLRGWLFRVWPNELANPDLYLPASGNHPNASERFRRPASAGNPLYTDLGLWNVYLNPDMPKPQANLGLLVCVNPRQLRSRSGIGKHHRAI